MNNIKNIQVNKLNNKEIIEDIKKHLTGINQVDIKYLNDQLKKYSKEKNDEVVYEIFTMIYKRLDPEALQKSTLKQKVYKLKEQQNLLKQ